MATFAAIRISDGLLSAVTEVPNLPSNIIQRAIDGDGGIESDWQVVELSTEQAAAVQDAYPSRSYLSGGNLTTKTLNLTSNKTQIIADGVDSATLTAETGDPDFTGIIQFYAVAPNGDSVNDIVTAVAGVASTTIVTNQVDMHTITAETVDFGSDTVTVEGV